MQFQPGRVESYSQYLLTVCPRIVNLSKVTKCSFVTAANELANIPFEWKTFMCFGWKMHPTSSHQNCHFEIIKWKGLIRLLLTDLKKLDQRTPPKRYEVDTSTKYTAYRGGGSSSKLEAEIAYEILKSGCKNCEIYSIEPQKCASLRKCTPLHIRLHHLWYIFSSLKIACPFSSNTLWNCVCSWEVIKH